MNTYLALDKELAIYTKWMRVHVKSIPLSLSRPFLLSRLLPSWRVVWSYRSHLEERDPIWDNDWSHCRFIRRFPSWGFLRFSSAVRQMPDLCTAPSIISLSPLSLATDVTDATLGASDLWLGNRTKAGGTATLAKTSFFLAVAHGSMDSRSMQ